MKIFLTLYLSVILGLLPQAVRVPGPGGSKPSGGGGPSSFAYVASSVTGCFNTATSPAQVTCGGTGANLHVNPSAGNLISCGAIWHGNTATATMTSTNNTWTAIGSPQTGVGALAAYRGQMFRVFSANAGADQLTLTITVGQTDIIAWECAVYSYTGSLTAYDGVPVYSTTAASGGIGTTGSVTTSNSSDLLFAGCLGVVSVCTAGSGFTGHDDGTAWDCIDSGGGCAASGVTWSSVTGGLIEEKVNQTANTYTATFGMGTTDDNILGLVAY